MATTGYVTNANGVTGYQTSDGNTVAKDSVFDPNSSNYNATVANSNGKISLATLGSTANSGSSALQSTVQGSSSYAPQSYNSSNAAPVKDNSDLISQQYADSLSAAQAALQASIAQSKVGYQDTIDKAPGTYQPLRDQASYAGAQNGQNLQEMLANNGQQGGVNRTESTAVNTATENNINSLNTQQQKVIDTANATIADLQAQGDIKGAQLVADNASQKLQALIAESNRVESTTHQYSQDAFNNSISSANLANSTNATNASIKNASDTLKNTIDQQKVTNTGYTQDGQLTVAGKQAAADIESSNLSNDIKSAQLREISDPNSTTNQLAKLGLDTAKLNYAQLPAQLQAQADATAQSLAKGAIDISTAKEQLKALPEQLAASLANTQANTNATISNAAATSKNAASEALNASTNASQAAKSSSGGGTVAQQTAAAKAATDSAINAATAYVTKMVYTNNNSTAGALSTLQNNKGTIITGLQNAGMSGKDALAYYTQIQNDLTGK